MTLRDLPCFSALPEAALQRLMKSAEEAVYARGETIFSEEQHCRHLHVLVSGAVKIYKLSEDGRERIIHVMKPGSFFGEDIVFGGDRYEASAQALSEAILLNIQKAGLESLVLEHPPFALVLLASFGRRLKRLMMLIGEVALQDVRKRLCRILLDLAEEGSPDGPNGTFIQIRHADLAAQVGTARETLCRALGRLEQDGLIVRRDRGIFLRDRQGLLQEVPYWREDAQLFPLDHDRVKRL